MTPDRRPNPVASIRQRLLNIATERREDFQFVLVRYAVERLLYRLSKSPHADRFVLKGAMLLNIWSDTPHRPTRDVDFLGYGEPTVPDLVETFRQLCDIAVEDDGVVFQPDSVKGRVIREEAEYGGVQITMIASLGNARIPVRIDIGFGDVVTPSPQLEVLPSILGLPSPSIRAYNRETFIAEKLQAMVFLGMANSRMKDFCDIAAIARHFAFKGELLSEAIRRTFARRQTPIPQEPPMAFTAAFAEAPDKQTLWKVFAERYPNELQDLPLADVVAQIRRFLQPPLDSLKAGRLFDSYWPPNGPWQ